MTVDISSEAFDWKAAWYALDQEHRAQAERIAELEATLDTPNRHAYRVGITAGKALARNDALREAAEKVSACTWGDYWNHNGMLVAPTDLAAIVLALIEGGTND